eukprot:gene1998-biopygen1633
MDWIADCNSLEEVDVSGCVHLKDFSAFAKNKTLKALVCRRSENLSAIDISDAIDTLDIVDCFKITDLSCLANKTNLKVLRVGGAYIKSIDWISSCINLEEVDVSGCFELNDLSPLGTLSKLHTLNLWCRVNDIKWITNCTALHTLNIQWAKTADLSPIKVLTPQGPASGASECGWIADCQQLEEVDFSGSINLEDFFSAGQPPQPQDRQREQHGGEEAGLATEVHSSGGARRELVCGAGVRQRDFVLHGPPGVPRLLLWY